MRKQHKRAVLHLVLMVGLLVVVIASVAQLGQVREFFGQATYIPAQIYVDTQAVLGPMPRPWRHLAQGGESHEWRIQPISQQVALLKPTYIRIDHIYDFYDIVSGSPGALTLDFSKLDLLLNDMKAVGATPYIALSYMPPAMSKSDIVDAPVHYSDWQYLVQKTIEHISGTRGFSDVYYEVWNEPDLFGGWKYYGNKNYLDLYGAAARGATNARGVNAFKIGGPATTALYANWITALLDYTSANNLRIDFVSWHRYTYDLDQFKIDIHQARSWVQAYPQYDGVLEYHISEWGHNSENDAGYDGRLSAAHTVAGAISMVGVLDKAFIFEIQDGSDPAGSAYWGRWGMLTAQDHGSTAKPRYRAIRMLDRIANQRLQLLGQGSMVKGLAARTDDGAIQTVLANYDARGRNFENVPITYQNITPGDYLLELEFLSGKIQSVNTATTEAMLQVSVPIEANDVVIATLKQRQ